MTRQFRSAQRRLHRGFAGCLTVALGFALIASNTSADASQFPASAEAKLTDVQIEPADGFNMQIDDNGFSNAGGNITNTHMFCVQAAVKFRCGFGPDDELRVQGTWADANLDATKGNRLAWVLTHRSGYSDIEVQNAIWCITNPGVIPQSAKGAQLCTAAQASSVPVAATLSLTTLGTGTATEGSAVHFALSTNAPTVQLSVSDAGAAPYLCGTAIDNAQATIVGTQLVQTIPATQRDFEVCLTRDNVASSFNATLHAALEATAANAQIWKHPTAPKNCQGLIDATLTTSRITATATGTWDTRDGWITVTKSIVGDFDPATTFTVELRDASGVVGTHSFPDVDESPWSHTFANLRVGEYTITETATGGATHVIVTPGGPIVVSSDAGTAVDVVNEFVGQLKLTKRTDIPVDKTFKFDVVCNYQETSVGDWTNPISLTAGESFTSSELPAGSVCRIDESDSGEALSTLIAMDSLGVQSQSVGTQSGNITIINGETTDVVYTNTFSQGSTLPSTSTSTSTSTPPTSGGGGSTTSVGVTSTSDDGPVNTAGSTTSTSPGTNGLADTGANSDRMAVLAGFALVSGGVLMLATHRRRRVRSLQ